VHVPPPLLLPQLKFFHELVNLKLKPRVVIQDEFPGFGFFNGFEIVEN
jgi:hypothetical protein